MGIGDELLDERMRNAAFEHLRTLNSARDHLTSGDLAGGFQFEGERIPLVNPQRGIFKPRQMSYLLSIRTVFPRPGARIWYDDQRHVHKQLYESTDFVDYAFMGNNPEAADNRWLRDAFENKIPVIYFIGIAPGRFTSIVPCYIAGWDRAALKASIGFGDPNTYDESRFPDTEPARRYALRTVQQRLHQASFRQAVMAAYGSRCALSGFPEPVLLDAAHIISDKHEVLGQPVVPNGIPLSKLHHAAFDAHLIGIDPNFRMHVSPRLLEQNDGPMLEAMKKLDRELIRLPSRIEDLPDRDRLAMRFAIFKERV